MLKIDYISKDWRDDWDIKELRQLVKKYKYVYEIHQNVVDSNFMLGSTQPLTVKQQQYIFENGIDVGFFDDGGPVQVEDYKTLKHLMDAYDP